MEKFSIYGPPGTGKTTFLLELLEKELKTVNPYRIAFVSYTKKGTYEGAARAKAKFNLKEIDVTFFRTIHSLCFREIGATRHDMFSRDHYRQFSKITGISFTGHYTQDYHCSNDEYLHAISMEKHNPRLAEHLSKKLNDKKYNYIKFQFAQMKKQLGIYDFDDLLEKYLEHGEPLRVKTAFIDEGQDLTTLQWRVVTKMFSKAEKIVVAGDDDQAVYEWSGADVNKFLKFSHKRTILNKSYRLPQNILDVAAKVSFRIKNRQKKKFVSNGDEGLVDSFGDIKNVDFKGGELVLARTNYILKKLAYELKEAGIMYTIKGYPSVDPTMINAVKEYAKYCHGIIGEKEFMRYKGKFKEPEKKLPWNTQLKISSEDVIYLEKIFRGNWNNKPSILLETYHSSKGSESDHVIVSTDLSKRVHDEMLNNMDAELRCLYVGLTRAKKRLSLLVPAEKFSYYQPWFT